jgi:hypothetical protein
MVFTEYHYQAKPQSIASRPCYICARERQAVLYYKRPKIICAARVKAEDDELWQSVDVTDSLVSPFASDL